MKKSHIGITIGTIFFIALDSPKWQDRRIIPGYEVLRRQEEEFAL
jgi:hypothetical protein